MADVAPRRNRRTETCAPTGLPGDVWKQRHIRRLVRRSDDPLAAPPICAPTEIRPWASRLSAVSAPSSYAQTVCANGTFPGRCRARNILRLFPAVGGSGVAGLAQSPLTTRSRRHVDP